MQYFNTFILACNDWVQYELATNWSNYHIIDLIITYEEVFVNYLVINTLIAIENVFTGRPKILVLHM